MAAHAALDALDVAVVAALAERRRFGHGSLLLSGTTEEATTSCCCFRDPGRKTVTLSLQQYRSMHILEGLYGKSEQ